MDAALQNAVVCNVRFFHCSLELQNVIEPDTFRLTKGVYNK